VYEARRRFLLSALKLFDLALLVTSFGLATMLVVYADESVSLSHFLSIRVKIGNCAIFAAVLLAWHAICCLSGMYKSRRLSTKSAETADALKATTFSAACLVPIAISFSVAMVTARFLALFWAISTVLLPASRLFLRYLLSRARRDGRNIRYVLILGTNSRAIEFARSLAQRPERGYRLLGFVDDNWSNFEQFQTLGFPFSCDRAGLAEFLRRNVVDEVAFYLPLRSHYEYCSHVAAMCEEHGIVMRFASDIFTLKTAQSRALEVDGEHYIAATYLGAREGWPLLIKQILDVVLSAALIFLLSPLLLLATILIKLSSDGPVFFHQERLGLNKRRFVIYKFRTMVPDAEKLMAELEDRNEVSGPVFKITNDPRITPIGRILRRTSIDELPQLFNVLKGDMSLVGPRPLPVRDYEGFSKDWQRRRFSIRPGLTCLWQVTGRSSVPFEQWMKLDLQYLDEWSLWLDLKILARTIPAVLKGSGAV
jgi:exopolysaccharide biosynthesis polyprenyl glycosylphosphotransferase